MKEPNYYELLGVPKNADTVKIKSRYHLLAKKLHPDKNGGSAEKTALFVKISAAYEVLIDDQKRAAYDLQLAYEINSQQNHANFPQNQFDSIKTVIISGNLKFVSYPGQGVVAIFNGKQRIIRDTDDLISLLLAFGLHAGTKFVMHNKKSIIFSSMIAGACAFGANQLSKKVTDHGLSKKSLLFTGVLGLAGAIKIKNKFRQKL